MVERTSKRVVALDERDRVAGLFDYVAEGVQRIGVDGVSGPHVCNGIGDAVDIFDVRGRRFIANDSRGCGRLRKAMMRNHQLEFMRKLYGSGR
jgi:hypothetical protein